MYMNWFVRCNQPTVFFSLTKPAPAISQHYFSLTANQHQPSATASRTENIVFGISTA